MKALRAAVWYLASSLVLIVFLLPVYWMFSVSLKRAEEIFKSPPAWYPADPQFGNFLILFQDGDAWSVWHSLVIAGTSTAIAMALGTLCAYGIVRFQTGGENLAVWILMQRLLPPIAIVFPLFLAYAYIGLADTYVGLILLYTAFALPYVVWMMRGYLLEVPLELEEAALVDGCSRLRAFYQIVLPLAGPGLAASGIYIFIETWNEFLIAVSLISSDEKRLLTVGLYQYVTSFGIEWGLLTAASIVSVLPVLILFLGMQRLFVSGLTGGAVKG
jgi:multiple sugar transport system permease protein